MRSVSSRAPGAERAGAALIAERYRIEAALGKGGVAQVYRVTDVASAGALALKLLRVDAKCLRTLEARRIAAL